MNHELLRIGAYPDQRATFLRQSLLITDTAGGISTGLHGLYESDTRHLSRYSLTINGRAPRLDSISEVDAYSTLAYFVAPPAGDLEIQRDALGYPLLEEDRQVVIRVARFVGRGLHEDVELTNHGTTGAELELEWAVDGDFADLMEARAGRRQQSAPVARGWRAEGTAGVLSLVYQHPELRLGTEVHFDLKRGVSDGLHLAGDRIACRLRLGPQERGWLCVSTRLLVDGGRLEPVFGCDAFGRREPGDETARQVGATPLTRLETPNRTVQAVWDRGVADLAALALGVGEAPVEQLTPAAGMPLYPALFGRDALTAAAQAMLLSPAYAEGALRLLARHIGRRNDDFFDEQPGRLPQQLRRGPLARLRLTTWLHDYGDYAAPCAFLVLLGAYHLVAGDRQTVRELLDPARRVLDWLQHRADLDGDGFLEYQTRSKAGQRHQGWKDSPNAVVDHLGRQVEPPIAPCEIQGYWYAAQLLMAEVLLAFGQPSEALSLARSAMALKRRFNRRFWLPGERFIAFGLDSEKQQIKAVTSNAAHCLAAGIVSRDRAAAVVQRLLAPDLYSGWGIRTLSSRNPAFNPFSYHLGSVWPVENATAAFGMARYGFSAAAATVARGIFDAAALFDHHRLPECFGGQPRDQRHPHPGLYPDTCAPQAWSATAVCWLLQAMLGIWSYAPARVLVVDPALPDWLPELTLHDLHVGNATVSLHFRRDQHGQTDYRILSRSGRLHVLRQPPPEALQPGLLARAGLLARSLLRSTFGV